MEDIPAITTAIEDLVQGSYVAVPSINGGVRPFEPSRFALQEIYLSSLMWSHASHDESYLLSLKKFFAYLLQSPKLSVLRYAHRRDRFEEEAAVLDGIAEGLQCRKDRGFAPMELVFMFGMSAAAMHRYAGIALGHSLKSIDESDVKIYLC